MRSKSNEDLLIERFWRDLCFEDYPDVMSEFR